MSKLEENMTKLDNKSTERIIFEAETQIITQDKKIKDLETKLEEARKKNTEKQNEIRELKNHNEKTLEEISALKSASENEMELRIKAEGMLTLTEQKAAAQETLVQQEKDINANNKEKIEKLEDNLKEMQETIETEENSNIEKDLIIERLNEKIQALEANKSTDIECLETENSKLRKNLAELKIATPEQRTLADNREMIRIIANLEAELEKTKDHEHELTVQVVEANMELKIRKELFEKLNKSYIDHIEEISSAYVQKFLDYQKEVNNKTKKSKNKNHENNQNESSAEQKQLKEKDKEIQKLTEELNKVAEEKYEKIIKVTDPKPRKQGLPNTYKNGCFIIAPIHALASCIEKNSLTEENNSITQHISNTKECINGTKTENEVEKVMDNIWEYSSEKWPQYKLNEGICSQGDAIEYMERVIKDSRTLTNETQTSFIVTTKCTNKDCDILSTQQREKNSINEIKSMFGIERVEMQSLIDNHLLKSEIVCPNCHQTAKVEKKVERTPNTMIVSVARHTEEGQKIETTITNKTKSIIIYENDYPVHYGVTGVIVHKGNQGSNGHYIYNHFNDQSWQQIDDHKITSLLKPEENSQGTIFLLTKMKREQQQIAPRSTPERNDYNREQSRNNNRTKSIPCRFYKYDKCRRGEECLFLHYTCKDFQQGKCPYNDYCKFRHPTTKPTRPMYQNRQY